MTTFLSEVLNIKHHTTLDEFQETVNNVEGKISTLKAELIESMQSCYELYDADIDRITSWSVELVGINEVVQSLQDKLEKEKSALQFSAEEIGDVEEELIECSSNISVLDTLVTVVQNLETAEPDLDVYIASSRLRQCHDDFHLFLKRFPSSEDNGWIRGLRLSISDRITDVYEKALKDWHTTFRFEKNSLRIDHFHCNLGRLITALKNINCFTKVWHKFTSQIWGELLSKACSPDFTIQLNLPSSSISTGLRRPRSTYSSGDNHPMKVNDSDVLLISEHQPSSHGDSVSIIDIKFQKLNQPLTEANEVFNNIIELITVFNNIFYEQPEVMEEMGVILAPKLSDALANKCLKNLILHHSKGDISKAQQDVSDMYTFVDTLTTDLNFKIEDRTVFDEFERNFGGLFVSQVREDLLANVRDLIKSDLHHTFEIIPNEPINIPESTDEIATLHKNPFSFPQCIISMSVLDMVQMLQDHLVNYPDDVTLIECAFNLYISIVTIPKHESDSGDVIPLTAVLIHNNSLYLCHHAKTSFSLCEDKIPLLRAKASQAYSFMMRSVRTKLNSMISEAMTGLDERVETGSDKVTNKFLVIAAEFLRLDNVFKNVLPAKTWHKTLATLVDHSVNELCSKVLSWDDISVKTANQLAESFTKFAVATSEFFKGDAKSVREIDVLTSKMVHKWQRFRLMTFVLTASMKEIEDKWVEGCGPLEKEFTADEVRKLVRALFQNTDRRAAFLASIK